MKTMAAMNEMNLVIEELRTAANALISAADSLMRMYSRPDDVSVEQPQEPRVFTLEEVRDILRRKCEEGCAADVKALIESFGVATLKDVDPQYYNDLVEAVQSLNVSGGDEDA